MVIHSFFRYSEQNSEILIAATQFSIFLYDFNEHNCRMCIILSNNLAGFFRIQS